VHTLLLHQNGEFTYVRLTLEPGASEKYVDGDLVLVSKDNPYTVSVPITERHHDCLQLSEVELSE
jgi:hypothetical protein